MRDPILAASSTHLRSSSLRALTDDLPSPITTHLEDPLDWAPTTPYKPSADPTESPGQRLLRQFTVGSPGPAIKGTRGGGRAATMLLLSRESPGERVLVEGARSEEDEDEEGESATTSRIQIPSFPLEPATQPLPVTLQKSITTLLQSSAYLPDGWLSTLSLLVDEGRQALTGTFRGPSRISQLVTLGEKAEKERMEEEERRKMEKTVKREKKNKRGGGGAEGGVP
ncbi:CMGC/CDK/CDK8 protein kinase Srb10 [Pseudohyphozyma bogoriensis]|nr:CMGC/CDK/CDK8 protein kinase Srb10 [Pseudohyphozyma bogoriensis]